MLYSDIVSHYQRVPKNVHTVPIDGREPKWFRVSVHHGGVYISAGTTPHLNSNIRGERLLIADELDTMISLYQRRKKGDFVSREASCVTQNQVYWYGIFNDLGL